ncbi:general secretion pathway protein N [Roseateles sp. YR242]|uniref:type II secretion system protein N n=1 Tax=Roseateles sp. YR242 TaxID=1855305 RepID=UPI0008AC714E|nr:type II secretion system protein N [Roseateles sp. YR242]SEL74367.1 general secretion pathway protein N [Roseateles sp. YR242]
MIRRLSRTISASTARRLARPVPLPIPKPPSRRWAWAGAILGLVTALVCWAPATWLASALASATQQRLLLADARGSIWSGSARVILSAGAGSRDASELPDRLFWSLRPAWISGGAGLQLTLNQDCCIRPDAAVTLRVGLGNLALRLPETGSDRPWIQWPASWLSGLGTPWNTLAPQGRLALSAQQFRVERNQGRWQVQGIIQLDLLDMSSRLSSVDPLGSYRLSVLGSTTPQLMLQTLQGPLQLNGQGSLGNRVQFRGDASAAPGSEAALANLLNIIGRREGARSIISVG